MQFLQIIKKVLMIHANFIEFKNKNKIIISINKRLKLLNEIVCEKYIMFKIIMDQKILVF